MWFVLWRSQLYFLLLLLPDILSGEELLCAVTYYMMEENGEQAERGLSKTSLKNIVKHGNQDFTNCC